MSTLAERTLQIQESIAQAAERSGRTPDSVTLVAVSKTHPPESIAEALAAGLRLFGESRVQEARAKIPLCPSQARWHFIGHLQRNKIRHALPLFELFHGVDSLETARDIDRIATELGLFPRVLLEVNLAGESSKFGFRSETLRAQIEDLLSLPRLQIEGLMTLPPPAPEPEDSRPFFIALRELKDQLASEFRLALPELSMGMSDDYPVAIEEGATLVRIGTALFGRRSGKTWDPSKHPSPDE
jgi:pyridoxal phosphate enzyme (YggS family)